MAYTHSVGIAERMTVDWGICASSGRGSGDRTSGPRRRNERTEERPSMAAKAYFLVGVGPLASDMAGRAAWDAYS